MLQSLYEVATQVAILFILIAVGFICTKKKMFDEKSIKSLANFVLYIVIPTVIINSFNKDFDATLGKKLLICVACSLGLHALFILLTYAFIHDKDDAKKRVLQFGAVFSNCGFMSLPLQQALLGDEGVFLGAAYVGVFNLITWTYGLVLISGNKSEISLKKNFINPGVIGVAAGLVLFLTPIKLPEILSMPLHHFANMNTPLPMVIIGFYLAQITTFSVLKDSRLILGIFLRLLLFPLLGLGIMYLIGLRKTILVCMTIAASAPTAANTTMFAAKYDKDTQTSVTMVAFSTLLSIITMPVVVSLAMSLM